LALVDKYQAKLPKLGVSQATIQEYDRLVSFLLHFSAN
jgi:hypothetical protein